MCEGELVLQEKLGHDGPHCHDHRAGAEAVKNLARDGQPEVVPLHRQGKQNVAYFSRQDETRNKTITSGGGNRTGRRSATAAAAAKV